MNYNQVIEYIDGTYDPNFQEAQKWAEAHNTTFEEDLTMRDLPKRYFVIGNQPIEPRMPTHDEVEANRAYLYKQYVDPLTAQIQRLRDEEQTEEVIEEINDLIAERAVKVNEIKVSNPYPEELK